MIEYRSTYRRTQVALPVIVGGLVLYLAAIVGAAMLAVDNPGEVLLAVVAGGGGGLLLTVAVVLAFCYRAHHWTVGADGLDIVEGPRLRFVGTRRHANVRFDQIASAYRVESGLDRYFDIVTRTGQHFRLAQAMATPPGGTIGQPVPNADLDAFVARLYAGALVKGVVLPAPREGLSFWNSAGGILWLLLMLLLTVAFAAAAAWALWDGGLQTSGRTSYGMGIVLLLPMGVGWVLWKSLRRRLAVLRQDSSSP